MEDIINEKNFIPGSFGCHEALHTVSIIHIMFDNHILEHPSIEMNEVWKHMAEEISEKLFDLYQNIGKEHI